MATESGEGAGTKEAVTVDVPPPGGVFAEPWSGRKLLGLLAVFGPAAIVASLSIGAGETIVVVREGAWAGYGRLWLVLLSAVVKGVFVTYLLGRYTAVSGEPLGNRLARFPGPRGWLPLTIIALEMIGAPLIWVPIAKPCGDLIQYIAGGALPAWWDGAALLEGTDAVLAAIRRLAATVGPATAAE